VPIKPPAPARFSTKQRSWNLSAKLSQSRRPNMSAAPPGVEGAMMRIGRVGQSAAIAPKEPAHSAQAQRQRDIKTLQPSRLMICSENTNAGANNLGHVARSFAITCCSGRHRRVRARSRARSKLSARSIKIIVPLAPGGLADTLARIVSQRLAEVSGQAVVWRTGPASRRGRRRSGRALAGRRLHAVHGSLATNAVIAI